MVWVNGSTFSSAQEGPLRPVVNIPETIWEAWDDVRQIRKPALSAQGERARARFSGFCLYANNNFRHFPFENPPFIPLIEIWQNMAKYAWCLTKSFLPHQLRSDKCITNLYLNMDAMESNITVRSQESNHYKS